MLQTKPGCYAFLGTGTSTHRTAGPALGPSGLHHAVHGTIAVLCTSRRTQRWAAKPNTRFGGE
ncbi:hypothetical protein KQH55_03320, partial [Mycetohabitans sp. B3]|nr:hypothetical protein [Mycetohabitans sp. B3]